MSMALDGNPSKKTSSDNFNNMLPGILVINTILENSIDTIYFKDRESRFLLVSKAQSLGFGCSDPHEVIGKSDFDFFPEEHAKAALTDEKMIMETGIPMTGKVERLVWPTGQVTWMTVSKYPLYDLDRKIIGTWGTSTDITELKLAKEELEQVNSKLTEANKILEILSAIDGLSGLYNHRLFFEEAKKQYRKLKSPYSKDFSIILLDVDNFKKINDTKGHLCGDYAIKHVADQIGYTIRISDKAFRYGGDEFIVLLPSSDKSYACKVAEQLRIRINENPIVFSDGTARISISAGVACSNEADDPSDLLVLADQRLYHSKETGKNRITSEG